ncbi:MAG: arsenate reductase family protein [Planctomycetota bacterium]|jgi:arsenate reductase
MKLRVWFNPACSKCRGLKELLEEHEIEADYRHYLEDHPHPGELQAIASKIEAAGVHAEKVAEAMLRKDAAEKGVDASDHEGALAAIAEDPSLLQRPIVETEDKAIVARPPHILREFLELDI